MAYGFNLMNYVYRKLQRKLKKISIKSLSVLLKKVQAVVQNISRKNIRLTVLMFSFLFFLWTSWVEKSQST
jgi:hypothetical protein